MYDDCEALDWQNIVNTLKFSKALSDRNIPMSKPYRERERERERKRERETERLTGVGVRGWLNAGSFKAVNTLATQRQPTRQRTTNATVINKQS